VVLPDLACPSSQEALLGPAGAAYTHGGIIVKTGGYRAYHRDIDGSLKKSGIMGAAMVAKDGHLPSRNSVFIAKPTIVDRN
jgi:hypothetical protein